MNENHPTNEILLTNEELQQLRLLYGKAMSRDEQYIVWRNQQLHTDFIKGLIQFLETELGEDE
jgi:hypothetical protein